MTYKSVDLLLSISALSFFFCIAYGFGPGPIRDFCVADHNVTANGYGFACKNLASVTADDFFYSGLQTPGNTTNPLGTAITGVSVATLPGLNTLGLSIARLDFSPNSILPPHTHPRATEILTVLQGSLKVGFVTSNPTYVHFNKTLEKGDVFVVPIGLVHYQFNPSSEKTVAIAALNSENPGIIPITNTIFGAKPDLDGDYLAKAFQLEKWIVDQLLAKF